MILAKKDLPTSIRVNETEYSIKSDFRTWIKFETMMQDSEIPDQFRLILLVKLVGNSRLLNEDSESVQNALLSFYRLNRPIKKSRKSSGEVAYRFEEDMPWIYAAFWEQYHMDLLTADLHWWEFKPLFDSLSSETMFGKIMGYRTADLSKMSESVRKEMAELKEYWSLSKGKATEREPKEIEAELLSRIEKR